MVRLTISMPDEYHLKVKKALPGLGFTSINDYLLDLLRHQIGVKAHQSDAIQIQMGNKKIKSKPPADDKVEQAKLRAKANKKDLTVCKHGYIAKLCKHEKCRRG